MVSSIVIATAPNVLVSSGNLTAFPVVTVTVGTPPEAEAWLCVKGTVEGDGALVTGIKTSEGELTATLEGDTGAMAMLLDEKL